MCRYESAEGVSHTSAFMISAAGDKIMKRWSLPLNVFSSLAEPTAATSSSSSAAAVWDDYEMRPRSVLKLVSSHSVRAHDKDINTTGTHNTLLYHIT